jgi:DNA-binding MarR family transcriptional regulator
LPEVHAAYGTVAGAGGDPGRSPGHEDAVERVVAAFERFMSQIASAHAPDFVGVGLTMSQAKVLYLVQAQPGLRMSDLAASLGVSLPTVSGVVERLVDHGLLDRRDDPADRRHVVLRLTGAGAAQLEMVREFNAGHLRALLAAVDTDDLATIERAIHVLAAAGGRPAGPGPASPLSQGEPA